MEAFPFPEKFAERMRTMLEAEWEEFQAAFCGPRWRALRMNTRKTGMTEQAARRIREELKIPDDPVPWAEHAWYYEEASAPGRSPYHDIGLYYIQEPSAMSAAELLAPQPGERILDLCAAPGGKTTQIASLLGADGLIMANEINASRCCILSQNVERMGLDNVIVTNETPADLAARFPAFFHRILVDAPCSGEGMFRKNEEALTEWSPENVQMCAERQRGILEEAAKMLVPGGTIVYSTCTFSPQEDEGTIGKFLAEHPEFSLEGAEARKSIPDASAFSPGRPEWGDGNPALAETFRLWPHHLHGEGHFLARMKKAGCLIPPSEETAASKPRKRKGAPSLSREQEQLLGEFTSQFLSPEITRYLRSGEWRRFGDTLFRLPPGAPELSGIIAERAGLEVGTFRKGRFEPSHALALRLGPEDAVFTADFAADSPQAAAYLRGESLPGNGGKGWTLVTIGGFSAGWGKQTGRQIKNHYPRGLRRVR